MLTLEQIKDQVAHKNGKESWSELLYWGSSYNGFQFPDAIDECMRIYRNQGIEQASKVAYKSVHDDYAAPAVKRHILDLKELI